MSLSTRLLWFSISLRNLIAVIGLVDFDVARARVHVPQHRIVCFALAAAFCIFGKA